MLGNTLKKYLSQAGHKIQELNRTQIDLSSCTYDELETAINNLDIELMINCAGIIKQRKNSPLTEMNKINSIIPHWLCKIANTYSLKCIHFTTDCVYDGKTGSYIETSTHNPVDAYGESKSLGEPAGCTIIRTSIIGEEKNNKLSLLEWVRSNKGGSINGYINHSWNGLTCLQVAKIITQMIAENIFWTGVRHLYSNALSKFELVSLINEVYDLGIKIIPIEAAEKIDRTLNSIFQHEFLIPDLYQQIQETKEFHKKEESD